MSAAGKKGKAQRGGLQPVRLEPHELDGDVLEVKVSAAMEVLLARPSPSADLRSALAASLRERAEKEREAAAEEDKAAHADGDAVRRHRRRAREARDASERLAGELEALREIEAEVTTSPAGRRALGACRAVYLMLLARGRGAKVSKVRVRLHKKHLRSDFNCFFRSVQVTRCLLSCFPGVFHLTDRGTAWIRSVYEAQDPGLAVEEASSVECSPLITAADPDLAPGKAEEWVLV